MLLDQIQSPEDLRKLSDEDTIRLAKEIRRFLVDHLSRTGGHLSSNLGVVELTLALHRTFNTPKDKLIFDVGHQCYVHKIVTGRKDAFDTLRKWQGLSGFPKQQESEYDVFDTGHATTSISLAYGLAKARDLNGTDEQIVCVIGDGSITGGMAYEAMNNAGKDHTRMIVVLNDNNMSINHNVGSVANHLAALRTKESYLSSKETVRSLAQKYAAFKPLYTIMDRTKSRLKYMLVPGIIFEELGFTYLGPVDGHDLKALESVLKDAKKLQKPVLVHVVTRKGKGYAPAQEHPARFHAVGPFDKRTGQMPPCGTGSWTHVFSGVMDELMRKDPKIVLITAAMKNGTGLNEIAQAYPSRVFDVGIAEEHAVTFAAGLAKGGMKPYAVIYSSFLQRSYDQIMEDVCLNRLPVTLVLDHAGIVTGDGETHQGVYDYAYLTGIPGMTVAAPSCREELKNMLCFSRNFGQPLAIRYPKGEAPSLPEREGVKVEYGKSLVAEDGGEKPYAAVLAAGACFAEALKAVKRLKKERPDLPVTLVDVRFIKPLDEKLLMQLGSSCQKIITVEEHVHHGGYGMAVADFLKEHHLEASITCLCLPDIFLPQDEREDAMKRYHLTQDDIIKAIEDPSPVPSNHHQGTDSDSQLGK